MAQQMIMAVVRSGDRVVDATLGNGHDTLLLARAVGDSGEVIGFDVQSEAVASTRKSLAEAGLLHAGVALHCCGHEQMEQLVASPVKAVMFNLGYLPKADKAVITTVETTLPALKQACGLLLPGGVMTIMCYPGHEGGDIEAREVVAWAQGLPRHEWRVVRYGMVNAPNDPPFLIAVEKMGK